MLVSCLVCLLEVFVIMNIMFVSFFFINLYFKYLLNFSASIEEIYVFDAIFCVVTFIYITLYISHQYLFKINSEKLHQEELIKKLMERLDRVEKRVKN